MGRKPLTVSGNPAAGIMTTPRAAERSIVRLAIGSAALLMIALTLVGCGGGDTPDSTTATGGSAPPESATGGGETSGFASSQPTMGVPATPHSASGQAVTRNSATGSTAAATNGQDSAFAAQMRGLLEQGDVPAVINQTTAAIERDANNTEALVWRANAYMRRNLGFEAAEDLDAAIRADAGYVRAYKERAIVRYAMGKRDEALADLNRAAQLAPSDGTIRFALAKFYWDSADLKSATAQLSEAIALSPSEAPYYTARAVLYGEQGDAQSALSDATRAIELAPERGDAYVVRGRVLVDSGEYERGIADLTKAISINPKQVDAIEKRGYAYFMLGDRAKADADRLAAKHARRR